MEWKTRLTELFGVKYPIIQGAFAGFGDSRLAAAVSEAGGLGMITAGALKTPENLRKDIIRARSITDKPIAVNLTMGLCPVEEMREVVIEEGIPVVETAAFNASEHGRRLKDAGVIWIHKVATVEHAIVAARQGADAVVIVGIEGTGFKSIHQLPISIALPLAVKQIDVPVVAAGGIGSGRGLIASLALGAEGIYMGTAFMATKECPIPERHKEFLVKSQPTDPKILKNLIPPDPEKVKKVMEKRGKIEQGQWLRQLERVVLKEAAEGATDDNAFETEEVLNLAPGSLAVGFLDKICTVSELIERIIKEAEGILNQ
jgi:NAD(P)H-dependent flavin oxidoreductase YrpB (nitropropane dioxygenase family)